MTVWLVTRTETHDSDVASGSSDSELLRHRVRPDVGWQRRYQRLLVLADAAVIAVAMLLADVLRFGSAAGDEHVSGLSYALVSIGFVPVWLATLAAVRGYETRYLGIGAEEFKRVASASLRLMATIAVIAYLARIQIARGYIVIALPLGTVALLLSRYLIRQWLHHRRRRHGTWAHRVLAVGGVESVAHLAAEFARAPYAGLSLVGSCVPAPAETVSVGGAPVVGSLSQVVEAIRTTAADMVAVGSGPGMTPTALRKLAWELEGSGVDLIVAPALTDVAGPRISIRPVAGLPLLHVDEPELTGVRQGVKAALEWSFAAVVSLLLLPVLLLLALAIRLDSAGAPVFRQVRVGKHGRAFTVYKLRTMHLDAESLVGGLADRNDAADGLLFKMRSDPRITRVGRWLRKLSLDELPQLWNVVRGDMALVGPRPPLPTEVARYGVDVARRLLVRPGMTGLWQVSGRSDLSWDDSVRLDLYYVENWSLTMDLMILWKTLGAVLGRDGAY